MKPIIREPGDYRLTVEEKNYQYFVRDPSTRQQLYERFLTYRRRALQRMWRRGETIYGYSETGE